MKHAGGRPPKDKAAYAKLMLEFFNNPPPFKKNDGTLVDRLPTFEFFATINDINTSTLREWNNTNKEFSATYKKCQQIQKDWLIQHGMSGEVNPTFAIFVSKNITDMKDRSEVEQTTKQIIVGSDREKSVLDEIGKDE